MRKAKEKVNRNTSDGFDGEHPAWATEQAQGQSVDCDTVSFAPNVWEGTPNLQLFSL